MAPPTWAIFAITTRVSADLPPPADFSLDLAAPPRVSHLTLGPRLFPADPDPHAGFALPRLLTADPSHGLVLAIAPPSLAARPLTPHRLVVGPSGAREYVVDAPIPDPACFVLHLPAATARRAPDLDRCYTPWPHFGVIAAPAAAAGYMLAAFRTHNLLFDPLAKLICFSPGTGERVDKVVRNPRPPCNWHFDDVFSHDGKLWWVDIDEGLLACDPFADRPDMAFVALPETTQRQLRNPCCAARCFQRSFPTRRCVMLSDGRFRCVEAICAHSGGAPTFAMRTLDDPETAEWTLEYEVAFTDIWADDTYTAAGLPPETGPSLALIHPYNPDVLYFYVNEYLVGVDMRARKLVEFAPHELPDPSSSSFVGLVAWQLPPQLITAGTE
ncbi:hypothetical protein ACP4OV_020882 [Aristida adscensionis]